MCFQFDVVVGVTWYLSCIRISEPTMHAWRQQACFVQQLQNSSLLPVGFHNTHLLSNILNKSTAGSTTTAPPPGTTTIIIMSIISILSIISIASTTTSTTIIIIIIIIIIVPHLLPECKSYRIILTTNLDNTVLVCFQLISIANHHTRWLVENGASQLSNLSNQSAPLLSEMDSFLARFGVPTEVFGCNHWLIFTKLDPFTNGVKINSFCNPQLDTKRHGGAQGATDSLRALPASGTGAKAVLHWHRGDIGRLLRGAHFDSQRF